MSKRITSNDAKELAAKLGKDCVIVYAFNANLPEGWLQTARITTNYRQLKTIYRQRLNHRLKEWQDFCHLLTSNLPIPELFTTTKEEGK